MEIVVDQDRCMGHARCNAIAPEVYPLDDEGFVMIDRAEVDDPAAAASGAAACPERAITVS